MSSSSKPIELLITLYSEQSMTKRYHVTRVRHLLEGTTVEAASEKEAIEKSRKVKRAAWGHIDSKRRRSYVAQEISSRIAGK